MGLVGDIRMGTRNEERSSQLPVLGLNVMMGVTAVDEIGAGVFSFDVGLQLLRLREILAAQMALRSTSVRIGRTAVRPMHIQISRSQETLHPSIR